VPPLRYILTWSTDMTGPRWLLEHSADPNLSWGEHDDAPLHTAAQRWDVPMVELLVRHGADIHRRRKDGRTAHTLAELHGNADVAAWLLAHGAKDDFLHWSASSPLANAVIVRALRRCFALIPHCARSCVLSIT
jgi:ankyrin repeat protein